MKNNKKNKENLFEQMLLTMKRFIHLADDRLYTLLACFVVLTYCYRDFDTVPYLHVYGYRESGKTTLLKILNYLCCNPRMAGRFSAASLYRSTQDMSVPITLIYDESRDFAADIVGIINTGYDRNGQVCIVDSSTKEPIYLSTFGPKVIAGTDGISEDTLRDRCIKIVMNRSYEMEEFKHTKHGNKICKLKEEIQAFATENEIAVLGEYLRVGQTKKIHGRNYQLFAGLFAVAKLIDKSFEADIAAYSTLKSLACDRAANLSEEILAENDDCRILSNIYCFVKFSDSVKHDGRYLVEDMLTYLNSQDEINYTAKGMIGTLCQFGVIAHPRILRVKSDNNGTVKPIQKKAYQVLEDRLEDVLSGVLGADFKQHIVIGG